MLQCLVNDVLSKFKISLDQIIYVLFVFQASIVFVNSIALLIKRPQKYVMKMTFLVLYFYNFQM